MKKFILLILLYSASGFSQTDLTGKKEITVNENGVIKKKTVLNPLANQSGGNIINSGNQSFTINSANNTNVRWNYTDPVSIGDYCFTSGNGKYNVTGWDLNNERISLYGNQDANPVWEFASDPNVYINFVSISDTGGVIASGSYYNIYLFKNTGSVPFFNYDLTLLPDTGIATALDLTKDGNFLVCSASRNDSSTIFGFNSLSTVPVWSKRIVPSVITGGAAIQGLKISGNDSLLIVNTYAEFFIFKTYTGELVYRGLINPGSPANGTQSMQGINGDGSVIATINYTGVLNVYKWNGTTYNFQWANQEPPGTFYNWYTSVDISYDGDFIAAGTLNFVTSNSVDGKIKVFKRSGGGTPDWTYAGCGYEVSAVSFSKSGNILSASSWGEFSNNTEDLYIFKTFLGNVPIFKVNTPGSFFYCNTSTDGRTVVASGKAVHARQFGSGGLLYNIDVDTSDIPPVSVNSNYSRIDDYKLSQNYPNPFNPITHLEFGISNLEFVSLKVYDALGNEVQTLVNENKPAGSYNITFDGSNLASGIYYYKLISGNYSDTKKMILLK